MGASCNHVSYNDATLTTGNECHLKSKVTEQDTQYIRVYYIYNIILGHLIIDIKEFQAVLTKSAAFVNIYSISRGKTDDMVAVVANGTDFALHNDRIQSRNTFRGTSS